MARYAIIENGTVTNVIEAEAEFAESIGAVLAGSGAIGDLYRSGKFTKPAAPAADPAEVSKLYEEAVQAKLNAAAIAARYDSIATAVSYAEEPAVPKFQNDGIAFRAWRSHVWAYAYEQLALVLAGEREQPTVEAFLLELPVLELPA